MSQELSSVFSTLVDSFLDLIYRQKCLNCSCLKPVENYGYLLCKNCGKNINYLSTFPHHLYKGIAIYSASEYCDVVRKIICLLKFSHRKKAAIILSYILFNYFKKLDLKEDYLIIYPQSHFLKKFQRGYEHMLLIAQGFSKLTGFEYKKNVILKIKHTKPQYKAKDRFKNIKGAYKINEKYIDNIKDKNILLIDDITTSGATLEEIINSFLDLGINNITCLTVSKAIGKTKEF